MLEIPFWLGLLYWSLMPATKTPWFEIASIPVDSKDILAIVLAIFYLLIPAFDKSKDSKLSRPWYWHKHLPILTIFMLVYGLVSVSFSEMHPRDAIAMRYTLILTGAAFILAYNLIVKKSQESIRKFLWQLTICLALLGLLYSAASLFPVGLGDVRSEFNERESDFGILRVAGPLFIPSTGYFILIPALAFSVQEFVRTSSQRLLKLAVMSSLMLTIFATGARGGILLTFAFFIFLVLFMKNKKQASIIFLMMIFITTTIGIVFFSRANPERLQSLEDTTRQDTYSTSFKIVADRSLEENMLGSGYGSYWAWYLPDNEEDIFLNGEYIYFIYPYGNILFNPHSAFLIMMVELGIIGISYFAYLWLVLIRLLLLNLKEPPFPIFSCGIVASAFSVFFDCFIFKYAALNTVWWIFLLGALALNHNSNDAIRRKKNYDLHFMESELKKLSISKFDQKT